MSSNYLALPSCNPPSHSSISYQDDELSQDTGLNRYWWKSFLREHLPDELERNEHNEAIFYCKLCKGPSLKNRFKTPHSSNFKRHLEKRHNITNPDRKSDQSTNASVIVEKLVDQISTLNETDVQHIFHAIQSRYSFNTDIQETLIKLAVRQSLPFSLVEWEDLRELLRLANSSIKLPTRQTFTKHLIDLWRDKKGIIQE